MKSKRYPLGRLHKCHREFLASYKKRLRTIGNWGDWLLETERVLSPV
jgi:hypothetical protein